MDQLKQNIEELLNGNREVPVLTPFAIAHVQLFDENNQLLGYGKKKKIIHNKINSLMKIKNSSKSCIQREYS